MPKEEEKSEGDNVTAKFKVPLVIARVVYAVPNEGIVHRYCAHHRTLCQCNGDSDPNQLHRECKGRRRIVAHRYYEG